MGRVSQPSTSPDPELGIPMTADERRALRDVEAALHRDGWASFVSYDQELRDWRRLAREVNAYPATIDDYTNDLTSRDALELILQRCPTPLTERLSAPVSTIDELFRAATVPDVSELIGQFYRTDDKSGWWWRRLPERGSLATYLSDFARSQN